MVIAKIKDNLGPVGSDSNSISDALGTFFTGVGDGGWEYQGFSEALCISHPQNGRSKTLSPTFVLYDSGQVI